MSDGLHIPELTAAIRTAFSKMPHLLDKLPKRWLEIRDQLKARAENYITLEDYFAVCRSQQMEEEKALFLSDYLHDLGIILHFRHDPVLADTVILKPGRATGAVYALIDSLEIQNNKGRFHRADLCRYWDRVKYPKEKYPQLLRLLEKFELCFPIVGTDDYILPELLPAQPPFLEARENLPAGTLQLHYSYEFMPAGIVTRFISRLHYLIRQDHYWKNGVELGFSGSTALVKSDEVQERIRVSVSGAENSQLLGVIRSHFDHIHETLNLDSLDTGKIDRHIMKLLCHYDRGGLRENYILVYVSAGDFAGLCQKYRDHLDHIDYETYPLQSEIKEIETGFNKIKAYRARHRCNTGETVLDHILVEM